jgi:hypothetical protein
MAPPIQKLLHIIFMQPYVFFMLYLGYMPPFKRETRTKVIIYETCGTHVDHPFCHLS